VAEPTAIPPSAKLSVVMSFAFAILGVVVAFAPYGYGFVTIFIAAVGVMLSGIASRNGVVKMGALASRANMLGVVVYVTYMITWIPTTTADHEFPARIIEAGELADQSVFDEDEQSAGKLHGLRMELKPCDHEWVIRVTGKPNSHLGLYVPLEATRECMNQIPKGADVTVRIRHEMRALTGESKGFYILGVGACDFAETDSGAVVKADACPSWF
jgi:hypothetical protein